MDSADDARLLRQMHFAISEEIAGSLQKLREVVLRERPDRGRASFLDVLGGEAFERGPERDEAFASGVSMCVEEALRVLRSLDMNRIARRLAERADERPLGSSGPFGAASPIDMENTE